MLLDKDAVECPVCILWLQVAVVWCLLHPMQPPTLLQLTCFHDALLQGKRCGALTTRATRVASRTVTPAQTAAYAHPHPVHQQCCSCTRGVTRRRTSAELRTS